MNINTFGSNIFPGITIVDNFGNEAPYNTGCPNADTITNPDGSKSCAISPAPIANAAGQYRPGCRLTRRLHRRLSKSIHALGNRHLDFRKKHHYLWRQLCLHPAEHPRSAYRQRHHRHFGLFPIPSGQRGFLHARRLRHHCLSSRAMPTATFARAKPASTFRTNTPFVQI